MASLAPGTRIGDRYVVEGLLGGGGMADVYAAIDTRLGAPVALKVLRVPAQAIAARLEQEGRIQAQLRHPNVVAVTDRVTVAGSPGLVMERVDGPSLAGLLGAVRLPADEALRLAHGVLAGVRAAHDAGLVHRDLKPANVLLARVGDDLVPKVADFGLARMLGTEGHGTRTGVAMGTPRYMAPEQIRSAGAVDHRADLFSFGALIYEMFVGEGAFAGDDTLELFNAVCAGAWGPLPAGAGVPAGAREAIAACLQVVPDHRPQDAAAVAAMLGPVPTRAFSTPTLAAHARPTAATATPSSGSPTFDLHPSTGGAAGTDTWDPSAASTDAVAPVLPARPGAEVPTPAQPAPPRRRWLQLAGAALLVAAAAALVASRPSAPVGFTPAATPPLAHPRHQALFDQAWAEYQANEDLDAIGHLDQALQAGAADPAVHLLRAACALGFDGWETFTQQVRLGAAAVGDAPGPVGDLLRALDAGLDQDAALTWWTPTLRAHTTAHPTDWLAWVLWAVGMFAAPGQVPFDDAVVEQVLATNPEAVASWVVAVELRRAFGDLPGASEAGQAGLARHPGAAALRGSIARVLLEQGDIAGALEQALACVQRDPQWAPCRTTAAGIAVRQGDDALLAQLVQPLQAPEADLARASQVLHGVAQALEGHGRPAAAAPLWQAALDGARAADQPGATLDILAAQVRFASSPLRADADTMAARLRALDAALADPELPRRARQAPGRTSQVAHALASLRSGDTQPAADLLPQLSGADAETLSAAWRAVDPNAGGPVERCDLLAEAAWRDRALSSTAAEACAGAQTWDQGLWAAVQAAHAPGDVEARAALEALWPRAESAVPIVAAGRAD